jgi:redox-sensitive bicupin YhaK (pirin superfamily)
LTLPEGHNTSVFVLEGRVSVNSAVAGEAELVVSKGQGSLISLEANDHSRLLIMSGKPISEPIARYGPFVMNTKAELVQAVEDYQRGRMGHLSSPDAE